jgi:flagellar hook assembly protein FlgD
LKLSGRCWQETPNPSTTIQFSLPASQHVRLVVHDVADELVTILADVFMPPGPHELTWDGRDNDGREMPSGVYFYQLEVDGEDHNGKMVLVR